MTHCTFRPGRASSALASSWRAGVAALMPSPAGASAQTAAGRCIERAQARERGARNAARADAGRRSAPSRGPTKPSSAAYPASGYADNALWQAARRCRARTSVRAVQATRTLDEGHHAAARGSAAEYPHSALVTQPRPTATRAGRARRATSPRRRRRVDPRRSASAACRPLRRHCASRIAPAPITLAARHARRRCRAATASRSN